MLYLTAIANYLQTALVGALAVGAPDVAVPEPDDAATEEVERRECRQCTMSGPTGSGREWGSVCQTMNPDVCVRQRTGGEAPIHEASCHSVAKSELGCNTVVDA